MKKIDVGQAMTILANFGVIAGIVFLALELRQNQQTLEQQLTLDRLTGRDAAVETFNGFRSMLLENPYLITVWEKGRSDVPLTNDENEQFALLCRNYIWNQVGLYARFTSLDLTQEVDATIFGLDREIERSERFEDCWLSSIDMISRRGYGELVNRVESGDQVR